jgi:hypothetical protein
VVPSGSMSRLPLLPLAVVAACGGGSAAPGPDAGPPDANPICVEAAQHDDLPWIQDNIFTPSCSHFSVCHQGNASEAGGLSLEDGLSRAQLVGVDSVMYGPNGTIDQLDWKRVVAGDPDHSYLLVILGQKDGPIDSQVGTMPYQNPLLCKEKRDAIERWIAGGALATPAPDGGVPDAAPDAGP